ncbi:Hypothetical_protein [Hexamita inflata]|uniref:Hypothetical_protein n=1 Tax=Hexamita inflata TaxID=28002 RepID=A0AA86PSU8_9EUKA|nr:Hypothetical protein HINF_LOCUS33335 [Hexamita inflata]
MKDLNEFNSLYLLLNLHPLGYTYGLVAKDHLDIIWSGINKNYQSQLNMSQEAKLTIQAENREQNFEFQFWFLRAYAVFSKRQLRYHIETYRNINTGTKSPISHEKSVNRNIVDSLVRLVY